jgi:hypothetical protein
LSRFSDDPEKYLATVAEMLTAEGMIEAAEILRISSYRVEETGYDNWNGGTTIWTIFLLLEPGAYAHLGTRRESLEEQIIQRLKPILDQVTDDWYRVTIAPKIEPRPEWRHAKERYLKGNSAEHH